MSKAEEQITRMTIDIDTQLKNQIKARASLRGMKLRDYVIDSLKNQILEEDEDMILGKLAKVSEDEGYIGVEKSQNLMTKILSE